MNRTRTVVMIAAGAFATLGVAGTALAAGNDGTPGSVVAVAAPGPSPSDDRTRSAEPSSSPSASSPSSAAPVGGGVDEAKAREIALRAAGGGQVEDVERESEHGREVWDVEVDVNGVEHEFDIDVASGEIVRHDTDDDRDDDRESDDRDDDDRDDDDRVGDDD